MIPRLLAMGTWNHISFTSSPYKFLPLAFDRIGHPIPNKWIAFVHLHGILTVAMYVKSIFNIWILILYHPFLGSQSVLGRHMRCAPMSRKKKNAPSTTTKNKTISPRYWKMVPSKRQIHLLLFKRNRKVLTTRHFLHLGPQENALVTPFFASWTDPFFNTLDWWSCSWSS